MICFGFGIQLTLAQKNQDFNNYFRIYKKGGKMYSVFLVDDEPILLEGIRSKIDWESIGLNFAGEATDG